VSRNTLSERALILAPRGRDAIIAAAMLEEGQIETAVCSSLDSLVTQVDTGAAFVLITEEALATADLNPLAHWIEGQEEWSDLPFILITDRGGGLERNPAAVRHLELLGNVTFLERPFHPTTLLSLARSALRARQRQYEARARLIALRESEHRYRTLFETMDEGFCVIQFLDGPHGPLSDYLHVQANPAYERHSGIFNVVGKKVREMVPDEADLWVERYREVLETGVSIRFEQELVATGRHLELAAFRIEPPSRREVAVIFQDITQRREAEIALRELNDTLERRVEDALVERETVLAQLHEAQKLEMIGHLTGGVAHDFNNLLTPITGILDMLAKRYSEDERSARLIAGALQSAERAKTLVQRLLGFARRQVLTTQAVDLAELVSGMRDLIASSIGSTIELRIVAPDDLPAALADPNQLELAVLNLCVNAKDAMPRGGMLTVAVEQAVIGPGSGLPLAPGAYVRLSVIDNGEGMDAETLARAVEPFYSTKEVGKGTGLGLSMVHGMAAQLGGTFVLASTPGKGTRADLYLRVSEEMASTSPQRLPSQGASVLGRQLSILVVDDEDLVRAGTAEMLREMGHTVYEASGGSQALLMLGAGTNVDAVITDYMMPRMDGAELADQIREQHGELPVLLVTGYAGGDLDIPLPQLPKPFRQTDLTNALRALLRDNVVPISGRSRA
jgi:PAS domain S-box-containing protein